MYTFIKTRRIPSILIGILIICTTMVCIYLFFYRKTSTRIYADRNLIDVKLNRNGSIIAGLTDQGAIVWNRTENTIDIHQEWPSADGGRIALSSDGSLIAIMEHNKNISLWSLLSSKTLFSIPSDLITDSEFDPSGGHIAVASRSEMSIFSIPSSQIIHHLVYTDTIRSLAWKPDGNAVAIAITHGPVIIWDLIDSRQIFALSTPRGLVQDLIWTPDGQTLLGAEDTTIFRWSAVTGQSLSSFTGHEGSIYRLAVNDQGTRLASGSGDPGAWAESRSGDDTIRVWDIASGVQVCRIKDQDTIVTGLAFLPDETLMVASFAGGITLHIPCP